MKKHFYSHLVRFESLHIELSKLDLSEDQREHLLELAASTTHHAIVDNVLSELSEEDKTQALLLLDENDHDKIWDHLKGKIEDIEEKIKKTGEKLIKEFHADISEVLKQSN